MLKIKYDDGGRSKYFAASKVGDCVTRAIAIATGRDYKSVYDEITKLVGYTPRDGVRKKDTKKVMEHFGGFWVSVMGIGTGCRCHLDTDQIPMTGKIVCQVTKHVVAIIDGVIHDTHDCTRNGSRCVYGYWVFD